MILSISEDIKRIFDNVTNFVENNSANPIFWIILIVVIIVITYFAISNLGDK